MLSKRDVEKFRILGQVRFAFRATLARRDRARAAHRFTIRQKISGEPFAVVVCFIALARAAFSADINMQPQFAPAVAIHFVFGIMVTSSMRAV